MWLNNCAVWDRRFPNFCSDQRIRYPWTDMIFFPAAKMFPYCLKSSSDFGRAVWSELAYTSKFRSGQGRTVQNMALSTKTGTQSNCSVGAYLICFVLGFCSCSSSLRLVPLTCSSDFLSFALPTATPHFLCLAVYRNSWCPTFPCQRGFYWTPVRAEDYMSVKLFIRWYHCFPIHQ